jgi:DNA-binding response OmpR family regulator
MLKRSILLAVNQAILALDLKNFLIKNNFIISAVVNTGEDLLNHYKLSKPDIIIVTYQLKGKVSGKEAIKQINNIDTTPIIILSGSSSEIVHEFAQKISHCTVLPKPLRHEELLESVNKFFNSN